MEDDIKRVLYDRLKDDKIKINWNKNPIPMSLFLSFLQVETVRNTDHLGYCMGWTLLENNDIKLKVKGGIVNGVEYLDNIEFGIKLSNPYNNFVNPFYIFEILNEAGRKFFVDYYKSDIDNIISEQKASLSHLKLALKCKKELLNRLTIEVDNLTSLSTTPLTTKHKQQCLNTQ